MLPFSLCDLYYWTQVKMHVAAEVIVVRNLAHKLYVCVCLCLPLCCCSFPRRLLRENLLPSVQVSCLACLYSTALWGNPCILCVAHAHLLDAFLFSKAFRWCLLKQEAICCVLLAGIRRNWDCCVALGMSGVNLSGLTLHHQLGSWQFW